MELHVVLSIFLYKKLFFDCLLTKMTTYKKIHLVFYIVTFCSTL